MCRNGRNHFSKYVPAVGRNGHGGSSSSSSHSQAAATSPAVTPPATGGVLPGYGV
jgi:hypothetical protein